MAHPLAAFVAESRRYLAREYPAKIRVALDALPEGDLWWRPNEASNSIGNLLLHLSGNIRQVSMTPRSELLITGDGPPDWATITFFLMASILS